MFGGNDNRGYTIVEVLLFLAISSFMFIAAAVFINGKQSSAEFRQGMNGMNAVLSKVINDVNNGVYPSNEDFTCTAGASGLSFSDGATDNQSVSTKCTYVGKMILFTNDSSAYEINTIAGRLMDSKELLITDLEDSTPAVAPRLTERADAQWGLILKRAVLSDGTALKGVGFVSSFAKYSSGLDSGAQSVAVYPIKSAAVTSNNLQRPHVSLATMHSSPNHRQVLLARSLPCDPDNPMQYDDEVCLPQNDPDPAPSPAPVSNNVIEELIAESKSATTSLNPNITLCFDGGNGKYGTIVLGGDTAIAGTSGSQRLASKIHNYSSTDNMPSICRMND